MKKTSASCLEKKTTSETESRKMRGRVEGKGGQTVKKGGGDREFVYRKDDTFNCFLVI